MCSVMKCPKTQTGSGIATPLVICCILLCTTALLFIYSHIHVCHSLGWQGKLVLIATEEDHTMHTHIMIQILPIMLSNFYLLCYQIFIYYAIKVCLLCYQILPIMLSNFYLLCYQSLPIMLSNFTYYAMLGCSQNPPIMLCFPTYYAALTLRYAYNMFRVF